LAAYGLEDARLTLLSHRYNTTFRVEVPGGPYVLRISRPQVQTAETIESEMAWLGALRRETDLGVPEPVRSRDGPHVVLAGDVLCPNHASASSCVGSTAGSLTGVSGRRIYAELASSRLACMSMRLAGRRPAGSSDHASTP
jgi:hypothetical protein